MADSDSDRTVDSDELEELYIKNSKGSKTVSSKKTDLGFEEGEHSRNQKPLNRNLKRSLKTHDLSDSDSDDNKQKPLPPEKLQPKKLKTVEAVPSSSSSKPLCKYGSQCYRKNPEHLREFSHASDSLAENGSDCSMPIATGKEKDNETGSSELSNGTQLFNFYLTKVNGIPRKFNQNMAFDIKDLLSPSRGKLKASAQFNYMIDIPWLVEQYPPEFRKCPLTIVHGEQRQAKHALEKVASQYSQVKLCQANLEIMYGTHHTKMMLLLYEDGFRVVIHTANLVSSDWFQKTQGMWISPLFPPLKMGAPLTTGDSSTNFKSDLIEYLSSYRAKELDEWITYIKQHDLSKAKVFLIGSIPGRHGGSKKTSFGHLKLRKVLHSYGPTKELVTGKWPVIGQFSSIGSLGSDVDQWLCGEWLQSLATVKGSTPQVLCPGLKLVYPTVDNVRCSLEGYPAGASLPYSIKVASKQPYLRGFLYQWKSEVAGRSEASPHIKTYMRLSPEGGAIAWFLVTSANLSKAAWGCFEKKGVQLMIRSYELGVLFMPYEYGVSDVFSLRKGGSNKISLPFPVPYDIPLKRYEKTDEPWIWDIPQVKAPDRNGNKWCPPL